jgi:hypothetical protein
VLSVVKQMVWESGPERRCVASFQSCGLYTIFRSIGLDCALYEVFATSDPLPGVMTPAERTWPGVKLQPTLPEPAYKSADDFREAKCRMHAINPHGALSSSFTDGWSSIEDD